MKIGVTIYALKELDTKSKFYRNGINQHIIFLYNYLITKTNNVYFISNSNSQKNKSYRTIKNNDYRTLSKLDVIISVGLEINTNEILKLNKDVKIIFYSMGNSFQVDTYSLLNLCPTLYKNSFNNYICTEMWISPQFEFSIDYYKYRHRLENVKVVPFFWNPSYLTIKPEEVKKVDNIKVGIFEPNLAKEKSFVIPTIACDFAEQYIENVYIFALQNKVKDDLLKGFIGLSDLHKNKKVSIEHRHQFSQMITKYCNVVVSYVENWDLNFLFLECFHLGIPLIHNSKILKNYGYYYEGCDATKAAEHIKNLKINGFNKEQYIARHREVLFKYSLENPDITYFLDSNIGILNSKPEKEIVRIYYLDTISKEVIDYYNNSIEQASHTVEPFYNYKNLESIKEDLKTGKNNSVIVLKNTIVIGNYWNLTNHHAYSFENNKPELAIVKLCNLEDKSSLLENNAEIRGYKSSLYFKNYYFNSINYKCPSIFEETDYKLLNNSKIAFVQVYNPILKDHGILSQHSVETYCKNNKYDYYAFRKEHEKYNNTRLRAKHVLELLPKYDYVVFLHTDIVITNNNYKFESITKLSSKPFLLCCDPNPREIINSEAFVVKNCPASIKLLESLNRSCMEETTGYFREYLQTLIKDNPDDFHIFDKPIFNPHPDVWNSDDLLVNIMGYSSEVQCDFMSKILKV